MVNKFIVPWSRLRECGYSRGLALPTWQLLYNQRYAYGNFTRKYQHKRYLWYIVGCSIMSMTTRSSRRRSSSGSDQANAPAAVCALCKVYHKHTSQVHTWQNNQARDIVGNYGITPDDIVCRPCRDDIRRITADSNYSPRWEKINHDIIKCCVNGCPDVCFAHRHCWNEANF